MRPRLVLVRHGQAAFDAADYDQVSGIGQAQAQALGRWWAQHAPPPRSCWSGGMQRQHTTASIVAAAATAAATAGATAGATATATATATAGAAGAASADCQDAWPVLRTDARLREYDHRAIFFAHRPDLLAPQALADWKQSSADYGLLFAETWAGALQRWMAGHHDADYPETWPAFRARCLAVLRELSALDAGTALLFTSCGPISVLLQACRNLPDAALPDVQAGLLNTGMTELWPDVAAPGPGRLGRVNASPHLDDPALRTLR